jgi:hypothetical protein
VFKVEMVEFRLVLNCSWHDGEIVTFGADGEETAMGDDDDVVVAAVQEEDEDEDA